MPDETQPSDRDQWLERVIADYLRSVDAGQPIDPQQLIQQHSDLADELRSFFANRAALERLAEPLKGAAYEPTVGLAEHSAAGDVSRVRYFGDYELLEELGRGGMGVVYKARQTTLNRLVALKMILSGQLASPDDVQRFKQEAEAAANLDHPNIAPIYEIGEHEGQHYFSMKFIEGRSLFDALPDLSKDIRAGVELLVYVARGVHHAHQRGVLHRDLKPANVLLDQEGTPYVTDFGLAKRVEGGSDMTQTGAIVGTPSYMAPEQASGEKQLTTGVDVYSLGAMLYELLTGHPPFRGDSPLKTLLLVQSSEPARPSSFNQQIDRDLETIALKCLEKDPARRYDSAVALTDDLDRYLRGEPITARSITPLERTWRWCKRKPVAAGLLATAAALLLTLGVGGWLVATREAAIASREAANASEQTNLRREANDERQKAQDNLKTAERNAYNSDMLLVQRDWEDSNIDHFRERLDRHRDRDDLRGFEWEYWDHLAHSDLLTLRGHSVRRGAFSADWTRLASRSSDDTVKVWNAATGLEEITLKGITGTRTRLVFSPDGTRLASASSDKTVKIWVVATGQEPLTLKGHTAQVIDAAFNPDETRLASASLDKTVKVWDLATGLELFTLGHSDTVQSVAFSPDGTRLASASFNTVKLWDAVTGQGTRTLKQTGGSTRVVFSPDGTRLASASLDFSSSLPGGVTVWDAATGQETLTLKGTGRAVFSPDGTRIAANDRGGVTVWDATTGRETLTLKGAGAGGIVAFSPDGTRLASKSYDSEVKVWDAVMGQKPLTLKGHIDEVNGVAFSPDGTKIATASGQYGGPPGEVKVWDAATGLPTLTLRGHTRGVVSVAFSPDGTRLASASFDATVKIWDAATEREPLTLKGHTDHVTSVAFSPDGTRLASASYDQAVKVWDAATGQELFTLVHGPLAGDRVLSVAFSPDGTRLASAGSWRVKLWDAATRQELFTLGYLTARSWTGGGGATSVVFSPDGTQLASASVDNTVKLWDAVTGQGTSTLKGHTGDVFSVAFSPDGKRLASAGYDKTVKVWDAATGRETLTLTGHTRRILSVAFSPDGRRLASASYDKTVKVWDARPWTPSLKAEYEARGRLISLRAKFDSIDDLRQHIRSDRTIAEPVREKALEWAPLFWDAK